MKESIAEYGILGVVSKEPMSGYDINKRVRTRMGAFWGISYGQIYPTLRMLEKDGYITKKVVINENRPNRKVYSITDKGIEKLQEWLLKPAEPESVRIEALLKVAFGEHVPKNAIIKHIEEFKIRNVSKLEKAILLEKELKTQLKKNEKYFYSLLTVLLGKNMHKASIEWADNAMKLISEQI